MTATATDGFLYGGPVYMQVQMFGPLASGVRRHRVTDGRLETRVVPPDWRGDPREAFEGSPEEERA